MKEVLIYPGYADTSKLMPSVPGSLEKFMEKYMNSLTCDIQIRINNKLVKELSYIEKSLETINLEIGSYLTANGYTDKQKYNIDVLVKNLNYAPAIFPLSVWNTD